MKKILSVVGARPNFMKIAPIMRALDAYGSDVQQTLVHTGQHFDEKMSDVFFRELELPKPDEHLGVSGGSHAVQTARIMLEFEPVILKHQPDWLVVVGDVNSTVACSLVASKIGVPIAHVEAGLRSRDNTMPEEINRKVTDAISDLLLTPSPDGDANLIAEGVSADRIHCVGNVMIDSLIRALPKIEQSEILSTLSLTAGGFVLATLHRPSNVDDPQMLGQLIAALNEVATTLPVVFPVHPRTRSRLQSEGIELADGIRMVDPLGYFDFMGLMRSAKVVMTDSGGVQEETTYLGVTCLTVRPNTERPITISEGTNRLVQPGKDTLLAAWNEVQTNPPKRNCPKLWDGKAAERIAAKLVQSGS
ncbi:UDP-2,3-diacetamido-2,3-dideoxy-D-glucuronate 2-epimerase [Stieleria maiorica]|uniref:UDP-2,3-diacetamido-2,3-dideoxy-D-glucuronate 2-epimerase n=1 Tax=Stieleria maiorica TaxID=2795974 RepID=A0A5B9MF82_9BACT|nr:UDP-N-acetylglucosamine 2-epimerase (non-hydrolyzing) [Stieleria maiorica]QEF99493.1 UDP-2,3-diacetamido-2,3-dideoxy-D-glucuronate 2-epimerase [Stieleria maiorica]